MAIKCESVNNQVIPQPYQSEINRMDLPDIGSVEVSNSAQVLNMTQHLRVEQMRMRYFEEGSFSCQNRRVFKHQTHTHTPVLSFAFHTKFTNFEFNVTFFPPDRIFPSTAGDKYWVCPGPTSYSDLLKSLSLVLIFHLVLWMGQVYS